jgi:hypothetical protein
MGTTQFTLRTVTPAGLLDAYLPDFQSLDISPVFSQAGTVVIKYPANGVNFDLLVEDTEIAIMIDGVEAGSLRCILEQIEGDDANEASDGLVWTFTCRTTLSLFDRAVVYPRGWPGSTNPPNMSWTLITPGGVLVDLLSRAQGRGSLTDITLTFDGVTDSAGVPWASALANLSYDAGTKYSDVIQNMVDSGFLEARMDKRALSVYHAGNLGVDRSTGTTPLRFQAGRDMKESPRKVSTRDLATTVLVAGINNKYVENVSDSGTMTQWGRREGYLSANTSDQTGVLTVLGDWKLATVNTPTLEVTHGLYFEEAVNPRPLRDFDVGDWSLSDVGRGWERYRIKQWVLSVDNSGLVSGSVTLNDLISEQIDKLNARLTKIQNGGTATGGSEEKDDGKAPAIPAGLELSTDFYFDHDVARAIVTVVWGAVTTNADGTTLDDLSYYLVRWKYSTDSTWQTMIRVDTGETDAFISDLFTNRLIQVQVQAVDKWNHPSGWTATVPITTAIDTTAPNKPAPPVVTSNVGTLRVTWSGLDSAGAIQVADFDGVEVHVGTTGVFTPDATTLKDYLKSRSTIATTITGLAYGTDWFVRLVAVDTSGNKSAASDQTSTSHAVLQPVVTTEIGTGQVGLGNTAFSDVGNLIDDGSMESATFRVARQSQIAGSHMAFDSTVASIGTWSLRSDSFSAGSIEYFTMQDVLPVKPGERIFGALDMRATSDATGSVNLDVGWLNSAGAVIDNTGAVHETYYTLGGLGNTVKDNAWHSRVNNVSQVAPVNAVAMKIIIYTTGRTAGTVWVDALEVRRQIDTLLVADLAVTTAKIALLAVNDAQIGSVNVGKLVAGSLTADITVSARIKTANTGARAELNSSGFQLFNASGTQTMNASATDGSLDMIGTLRTGSSGTRIEINPSGLPTIRLYSGAGTEYGFINGFTSSGTDVGVGFNSSPFSGNSTQLTSRLVAFAGQVSCEVVRADNQQTSGGYFYADPSSSTAGYIKSGDQGASFVASPTQFYIDSDGSNNGFADITSTFTSIGMNQSLSTEQSMLFQNTVTTHIGRWNNYIAATNNQGVFTGRIDAAAGFANATVIYGPTMLTGMEPICTIGSPTFDDTTGTSTTSPNWGVSSGTGSTTQFQVGWDRGVSVAILFWCFRI